MARMHALIIYESYFGNTKAIAESVAAGMGDRGVDTQTIPVEAAPATLPDNLHVLVLGAPTHNRGLPTPASRDKAIAAGGTPTSQNLGEWLDHAEIPPTTYTAVFDTATGTSWLTGSAAARMTKTLNRRKPPLKPIHKTFLVDGNEGPLNAGEIDAARTWGRLLSADARNRQT